MDLRNSKPAEIPQDVWDTVVASAQAEIGGYRPMAFPQAMWDAEILGNAICAARTIAGVPLTQEQKRLLWAVASHRRYAEITRGTGSSRYAEREYASVWADARQAGCTIEEIRGAKTMQEEAPEEYERLVKAAGFR